MKCIFISLAVFFSIPILAQITSPRISIGYSTTTKICSGVENKIEATVTGSFNPDNVFKADLLDIYNNQVIGTYDVSYRDHSFYFSINSDPDYTGNQVVLRIRSTSPAVQATTHTIVFVNQGTIQLANTSGYATDTLNPGVPLEIRLNSTTNSVVNVTLSDSTKLEIPYRSYETPQSIPALRNGDIFITRATNACYLPIPATGKASVAINPISISPGKINTQAVCEGQALEVTYSTNGGTVPEDARFKLRIQEPAGYNTNQQRTFEIPATRKSNGVLTATMPKVLEEMYHGSYRLAIIVENPKLVSPYTDIFAVYRAPTVAFDSQSSETGVGVTNMLRFRVSAPQPYTLEITDGVSSYAIKSNDHIFVRPTKTEIYEIKSLTTPCGVMKGLSSQKMVLTVRPGIALNITPETKYEFCENQTVRLPFVSNAQLNSGTGFTVEGRTNNGTNKVYQFDAKLINDSLEFHIPHTPAEWGFEGYSNIYSFRVRSTNPTYESDYYHGFRIRGIPRVNYTVYESTTLNRPGYLTYYVNIFGGTPITFTEANDGQLDTDASTVTGTEFIARTGNFGPKAIENVCYRSSDLARLPVTVTDAGSAGPFVTVYPPGEKNFCDVDSVEVQFDVTGEFGPGNVFQIGKSTYSSPEILLTVTEAGNYKVPAAPFKGELWAFVTIKSTNPEGIWSSGIPIRIAEKPVLRHIENYEWGTAEQPRLIDPGGTLSFYLSPHSIAPVTAEFAKGNQTFSYPVRSIHEGFKPEVPAGQLTTYVLKSLTNVCGTTEINKSIYLYRKAYSISIFQFPGDQVYCTNQEISVMFRVNEGQIPEGTSFQLQIRKEGDMFKTVAVSTSTDFRFSIPDIYEAGTYYVRVLGNEYIPSEERRLIVKTKPTAELSLNGQNPGGTSTEINYGESVGINYKLSGGAPWNLTIEGLDQIETSQADFNQTYIPQKQTQYRISAISNACGYGTAAGSYSVAVKPKIISFESDANNACSGSTLRVSYRVGGDLPTGQSIAFFLTTTQNTQINLGMVSHTYGSMSLPIPVSVPLGIHTLSCQITGTDVILSKQISIDKVPDIELYGNATINSGQLVYIAIRANTEGNLPLSVQLSDGTLAYPNFSTVRLSSVGLSPQATTTYRIVSATSTCGSAEATGTATITVNPPSERKVLVTSVSRLGALCEKDTAIVHFTKTGPFSAGSSFFVQLFDSQGALAKELPPSGADSPLKVPIPSGLQAGVSYRMRVASTDPNTSSGDYANLITVNAPASAAFAQSSVYKDAAGKAQVTVNLGGSGPWNYVYGNELGSGGIARSATASPDIFTFESKEASAYIKLISVSNVCGAGSVLEPGILKIDVILSSQEHGLTDGLVSIGPNPTSDHIVLQFGTESERAIAVYNSSGVRVQQQVTYQKKAIVNMDTLGAGAYILKIEHQGKVRTMKLVKR